jgi:hypothetical protein
MLNSTPIDRESLRHYARRACPFPPGSIEKMRVLKLRASLGLPLFVAGDAGVSYRRGDRRAFSQSLREDGRQ